jgi:hypothetical protein
MMRQTSKLLGGILLALSLTAAVPVAAQSPDVELNKKLEKYDPAAVKAALHYLELANMRAALAQMVVPVRDTIIRMVKEKNPGIDEATQKEFIEVFLKVMYVDNAGFIEKFTIVMMLDIFTTEEIVAIDKFYSSDVGRSMLKKMPQMMARMPQMMEIMMKQIVPQALGEAQKALKAKGKDIRL